jgi:hypothetical protein
MATIRLTQANGDQKTSINQIKNLKHLKFLKSTKMKVPHKIKGKTLTERKAMNKTTKENQTTATMSKKARVLRMSTYTSNTA